MSVEGEGETSLTGGGGNELVVVAVADGGGCCDGDGDVGGISLK